MLERRKLPRSRVYYGGMVAFNARSSTLACVVRNFSQFGAKVEFENAALMPDEVDFEIERKGISCSARLIWRGHLAAGLVFSGASEAGGVIPLNWARKLRASERANRQLQSRLDQLRSEY
ncbi:PilZ domain-containing protein [Bradyrhizobium sp. LjRoot220]|uniref:PilZ domain-containing protein n=1 Tax=Bradyrhizobium sp. LjRoot220 TaxID=3342284 RepID=UPI003ECF7436